jgi:hypothetical protein
MVDFRSTIILLEIKRRESQSSYRVIGEEPSYQSTIYSGQQNWPLIVGRIEILREEIFY